MADNFRSGICSFNGVVSIHETPNAVLCLIEGEEHWIPKSHIHDDSEVWRKGQRGELFISEWLALQKGLI